MRKHALSLQDIGRVIGRASARVDDTIGHGARTADSAADLLGEVAPLAGSGRYETGKAVAAARGQGVPGQVVAGAGNVLKNLTGDERRALIAATLGAPVIAGGVGLADAAISDKQALNDLGTSLGRALGAARNAAGV